MDAKPYIHRIEQAGFTVQLHGGKLRVAPASKLSDHQKAFIRNHRDALIRAIRLRDNCPPGGAQQAANDNQVKPFCTIAELPRQLVSMGALYCIEIHRDGPNQVNEMLEDLTWNHPRDWNALIQHFQSQIPKIRPP